MLTLAVMFLLRFMLPLALTFALAWLLRRLLHEGAIGG